MDEEIKIKIKSINNEECELSINPSMSTDGLKSILAEKKNVNKNDIRLIYQGQCLSNEKLISDYGIQNDHIIHLVIRKRDNNSNSNNSNNNTYSNNYNSNYYTNTNRTNDNINDPVYTNFFSNMNQNSNSSGATNTGPPFYFTHMRLTRNDNLENDPMGQNNIYSLLNDIMSQVNINPNFIYGAAAAASENIFVNGTNQARGNSTNVVRENKKNEEEEGCKDVQSTDAFIKKEEKTQKTVDSYSDKKCDDSLDSDKKKNKRKTNKIRVNKHKEEEEEEQEKKEEQEEEQESKKKKINKEEEHINIEEMKTEKNEEKDKRKETKKINKRKNIHSEKKIYTNKYDLEENSSDINSYRSKSYKTKSYRSKSDLSESGDIKEDEEKENQEKEERKKKKKIKNKYKKKKYYDYSSLSSHDEQYKKDEGIKKKNIKLVDEHFHYPSSYFYNNNNIRNNLNNDSIFNKRNYYNKHSHSFIDSTLKCPYNEQKKNYNYRDDFNEAYENANDIKVNGVKVNDATINDFLKKKERKKNISKEYIKNMFNHIRNNNDNDVSVMIDPINRSSSKNIYNIKNNIDLSNINGKSNACISRGMNDCCFAKNNYSNIVPLSDVGNNDQIIRNNSIRTNSRVINEDVALSSNDSISGNMRSIQMSNQRRDSILRRRDTQNFNSRNDPKYNNIEMNIPWRVIEQLLFLLEEETGYRRPDLSFYMNSYHNSNSIYVFFYLFIHINNIINNIIIQFSHYSFLNNDIAISSFSRISLILSLASVIFSKLSNFFYAFYDNFYFSSNRNSYRNSDYINHEYLREIRNICFTNNRNGNANANNNTNANNNRYYHNNYYNNVSHTNIDDHDHGHFPYYNNANDHYPLSHYRRYNNNRTNMQGEFEDYYKNYLPYNKESKNMILRRECPYNNSKEKIYNQKPSFKESIVTTNKMSMDRKLVNNSQIEQTDKIREKYASNNNSFLNFSTKNKSALNILKKEKKKKMHHKYCNENYLFKEDSPHYSNSSRHSSYNDEEINKNDNNFLNGFNSKMLNIKERKENISRTFQSDIKNVKEEKITEREDNKHRHNENGSIVVGNDTNKNNKLNTMLNNNLIIYDSNIDDIYDVSEDGKEKEVINHNMKEETLETSVVNSDVKDFSNVFTKNVLRNQNGSYSNVSINSTVGVNNDNNIVNDNKQIETNPSIPTFGLSSALNNVQSQVVNDPKDASANKDFEKVPNEVKEKYTNWVENSHIFSGQMIKICKNKRPLSNAYIGSNKPKNNISYSNLLQFIWKKNMSTINLNLNIEVTNELLNAFDFHILEFIKNTIKNNEDYKAEKFKYPNLKFCEEMLEEIERKDK